MLYYIQLVPLLIPYFALPYQKLLAMIPFVSLFSRPQGQADLMVSDWNNVCCDAGQNTSKQHQTDNPIRIKRFLSLGNPGIEHDPNGQLQFISLSHWHFDVHKIYNDFLWKTFTSKKPPHLNILSNIAWIMMNKRFLSRFLIPKLF